MCKREGTQKSYDASVNRFSRYLFALLDNAQQTKTTKIGALGYVCRVEITHLDRLARRNKLLNHLITISESGASKIEWL